MAITCVGPHRRSGSVDALADLVGRRRSLASAFCISRSIYFRCGTLAYAGGNSSHPGPHARCGARRRRNRDAARNSRAGRRNLIRVSNGLVGVNEACSGIRSLQTSLMIGLLFGELKRLSISRRTALVGEAVAIALVANFLRAVFLVAIAATKNISEISRWHDLAGYTIVGLVFVGTMGLAYLLGKSAIRGQTSEVRDQRPQSAFRIPQSAIPDSFLIFALCWLFFVEIGTASWYRVHETNLVSGIRWSVRWPERAPNFRKLKIDEEI